MLTLSREQLLGFRRRIGGLDARMPRDPESLRRAAWAGLQDSMPRAAVLSLHARVREVTASVLDDPCLVQVWGPRYSVYVAAAQDRAIFTLGRWPETRKAQERAQSIATQLATSLGGRRESYEDIGRALGVNPNALRYGTTTGTILIRWDGARAPRLWIVPAPEIAVEAARTELARRFLHVFGPSTPLRFGKWAGVTDRLALRAFESLSDGLLAVRTPLSEASILAADEEGFRAEVDPAAPARLLPSGDPYYLLWGADRGLLAPDTTHQAELWTSRVWPGAVLLGGEIRGTWRRAEQTLTVRLWEPASRADRDAVENEAAGLPIPGYEGRIEVAWE